MYGEWLRVTPAEHEHAKGDLRWALCLARNVAEDEDQDWAVVDRRSFGTDKTWHALDYLLRRKGFPVSIIFGEESFVDDPEDPEADWGYGAPQYLTPAQVQQAAVALADLTEEALIDGVDQAELRRASIYPTVWDRPGELPWAVGHLPSVKVYFEAAARSGDAMLCWIG
jgi:hypothetical protein